MQENDIFTNQKEVVDNLKDSAKNLGIDPDKVVPPEPKKKQILVAKKNCNICWGLGVLTIAANDVAVRTKEKSVLEPYNVGEEGTYSSSKRVGKFKKTKGRNSSRPEPIDTARGLTYCKCVKLVDTSLQTA